jgi:glycosyltransferase involved in cell wall biosynthesis
LRAEGARVHALDPARFSRPWTVLKARRRLRRVLALTRPDCVICHACWPHALFGPIARRASLPLVCWLHDVARGEHWIERRAMRTPPDLAIVCSRFNADSVSCLFPRVPFGVVHPPVPPPSAFDQAEARAAIRRELATPDDAVVIVHVSRMEPLKGQRLLIDALARLRDQPRWVAWIAGGAQRPHEVAYLASLRTAAHATGIADRVRFAGPRGDVARLLAAADIHCQPNTAPETFGITFIEAMDAQRPVVTTRIGGAREIVTPACGVMVEPDDPADLASA